MKADFRPLTKIAGIFILTALCAFWVSDASGQELSIFGEVTTTGNFFGFGARQTGMGKTGIASSPDGSAIYYNPASLSRIHRVEFQFGLTRLMHSNESSQESGRFAGFSSQVNGAESDLGKNKLGSLNLAVPVPTFRGSLVFALGIHRIRSFSHTALLHTIDETGSGLTVEGSEADNESGSIYLYTVGGAIDLSPRLSIGIAVNVYSGQKVFDYDYLYSDQTNSLLYTANGSFTEDFIGATIKGGIQFRPNSSFSMGVVVESPLDWQVRQIFSKQERYDDDGVVELYPESGDVEYDLTRPWVFGVGLLYRVTTLSLACDAEYIGWSGLSYGDNLQMALTNDTLSLLYRDVLNIRLGLEYLIPSLKSSLRVGLFSEPLANDRNIVYDSLLRATGTIDNIEKDRIGYSFGLGTMIGQSLMLEGSYLYSSYKRRHIGFFNRLPALRNEKYEQVHITFSYRY